MSQKRFRKMKVAAIYFTDAQKLCEKFHRCPSVTHFRCALTPINQSQVTADDSTV